MGSNASCWPLAATRASISASGVAGFCREHELLRLVERDAGERGEVEREVGLGRAADGAFRAVAHDLRGLAFGQHPLHRRLDVLGIAGLQGIGHRQPVHRSPPIGRGRCSRRTATMQTGRSVRGLRMTRRSEHPFTPTDPCARSEDEEPTQRSVHPASGIQNLGISGNATLPAWTWMRPSSAQRCSVGKTLPGLSRPRSSNAHLSRCCWARSASVNIAGIRSRFSTPTPCSPVSTPPTSTQSLRISAPNASVLSSSPGLLAS